MFDEIQRFVDEELLAPQKMAEEHWPIKTKGNTNFLAYIRRDGKGQVARWVIRSRVQNEENNETDKQKRRDREDQSTDCVVKH